MAMDYAKCAKEIFDTVGGRSNLVSAAHCATRLRLVTVDNSKINMKKLENIDGVKGVFSNNGQLQLIIGTGTVNKVYDEFLKVSGMTAATKEEVKAAAVAKQPVFKRMIKALGDVFVPILPAIVASGLKHSIYLPADPDRSICGKSIRRKYFPGCSHRYDHDPPEPYQRMVCSIYGCS